MGPHKLVESLSMLLYLALELDILLEDLVLPEDLGERDLQRIHVEGLFQKIICTVFHRLHRPRDAAEGCDDDDISGGVAVVNLLEQRVPIHTRHLDVRDDDVVAVCLDLLQGIQTVTGRVYLEIEVRLLKGILELLEEDLFIIDEQDLLFLLHSFPRSHLLRRTSPRPGAGVLAGLILSRGSLMTISAP
ncbi:MAG: hypothetical protein BWX71_01829 [Deltaproteobacteria bacterium ADurb.Bin072]|nr:MAG: hypothetical protein BWX71_01829 [Deltaproteobacteria bacterium ADurb.Bin072]